MKRNKELLTMAISNYLFLSYLQQAQGIDSKNYLRQFASLVSQRFSVLCVIVNVKANPPNHA